MPNISTIAIALFVAYYSLTISSNEQREEAMRLILWPAVLTLGVTLLRLLGELQGWSKTFFSPAPGGGFALVGISWLPPVFGVYFAMKLAKEGKLDASGGKVAGVGLLCIALFVGALFAGIKLGLARNGQLAVSAVASLVVTLLAMSSWKALGRTLLAYAFAARVPVAIVMLFAILGKWGTHYDVLPPNPPPELVGVGPLELWVSGGLVPQMTGWIAYTVVMGMLVGGIAVAVSKPKPAA
jgi:hypothetical protein